jgi:hypothetical protein
MVFVLFGHPRDRQWYSAWPDTPDMADAQHTDNGAAAAVQAAPRPHDRDSDEDDDDEAVAAVRRAFERGSLFASDSESEDEDTKALVAAAKAKSAPARVRVHADLAAESAPAEPVGRSFVFGENTVTW